MFVLFLSLTFYSCGKEKFEARSENRFLMGTICILTLYGGEGQDIYDGVFDLIAKEDRLMSLQREDSDLGRINRAAGQKAVQVSPDTYKVVESALSYARLSGGAFDPTIAPLVELWGISSGNPGIPPAPRDIEEKKLLTDYQKVAMKPDNRIYLEKKGMEIDLGGIAKGYIADKVKQYLVEKGVKRGIINLGGNIVVVGSKPGDQPWRIGIQNPFETRGNHIGIATVKDKTVVTSGIYERFFIYQGKRYHHILDPSTGYPVENDLASVTIITDKSIDADALSTSLFVLGVEKGLALIESINGAEAVYVTKDRRVIESSGSGKIFELYDNSFNLVSLDAYKSTLKQ